MKPRVRMGQIRFFINPNFTKPSYDLNLYLIIQRIARLICNTDKYLTEKATGYRWQLDDSNDWWLDIGKDGDAPNEIVIDYRYGHSPETQAKLSKLRDTIIWLLGIERFNIEAPENQS